MITFGSLFAGIGGFDLGFERAGMRCEWQVEISTYNSCVLQRHWPTVRRWDDVRTFPPPTAEPWQVDVICGGDPCQGNSRAGAVWNAPQEDTGAEFVRIVDTLRPRVVVRENPYPSRADALWPWWRMRDEFERIGYAVLPFRLRSCCFGASHRRDRVFLLGELPDANSERLARLDGQGIAARDVRGDSRGRMRGERPDGLPAPRECRSRNEIPAIVDRLNALGNAVDPFVAEWIGHRIMEVLAA